MLKNEKKGEMHPLRNFEAMDHIHERMRARADEGLIKLEPLIKKQLNTLYYEKKTNLYALTKDKKHMDD